MTGNTAPDARMQIEHLSIDELRVDERNARAHSNKQVTQIAASVLEFGYNNPILIDVDNRIIAGHGRLAAVQHLNWKTVPVVRLEHMNEAQRRAYAIADNRLAELAGWDRDLLRIEMQALAALDPAFDLEIAGFDTSELDDLLDCSGSEEDPADQQPEPDSGPTVTKLGDLWEMGDHRVICADACVAASYGPLMEGVFHRRRCSDALRSWADHLMETKLFKLFAVANANKLARIFFALIRGEAHYRSPLTCSPEMSSL